MGNCGHLEIFGYQTIHVLEEADSGPKLENNKHNQTCNTHEIARVPLAMVEVHGSVGVVTKDYCGD